MRALLLLMVFLASPAVAQMGHDPLADTYQAPLSELVPEAFRFRGPVRIVDGDTIDVETSRVVDRQGRAWGGRSERLRIFGIDAPERGARGYRAARDEIERMFAGGRAACVCLPGGAAGGDFCKHDRWGRIIAVCSVTRYMPRLTTTVDDVGFEMVRRGYARARYGCDYAKAERDARAAGRGLWPEIGAIRSDCD